MSERWLAGTATQFPPLCPSQKLSRSFFRGYENSRKHLVQPRVEVIIPCNLHELVHLDSGSDGAVAVGAVLVAKPAGRLVARGREPRRIWAGLIFAACRQACRAFRCPSVDEWQGPRYNVCLLPSWFSRRQNHACTPGVPC